MGGWDEEQRKGENVEIRTGGTWSVDSCMRSGSFLWAAL